MDSEALRRLAGSLMSAGLLSLLAGGGARASVPADRLDALADRFVQQWVEREPVIGEYAGIPMKAHDRLADPSLAATARWLQTERATLAELRTMDKTALPVTSRAPYAILKEQLEGDIQLSVCRRELWDVSHLNGWQSDLAFIAERQPVGSPAARAEALRRWSLLPAFVDIKIANLRIGLDQGYAAPRSVVKRVIAQMDALSAGPPGKSPFYAPAEHDPDPAFKADFARMLTERIQPAFKRYRDYLVADYLPRARASVAISELPDGPACYQAYLRSFTTLKRTPQEVYDLGGRTVAENRQGVIDLGSKLYGLTDFTAIVARVKSDPADRFASKAALLQFSRDVVVRGVRMSASLVDKVPAQPVTVEPELPFEDAAGVSSHFNPNPDVSKPAAYRIELSVWDTLTRGEAEVTALHETDPGHHLQIARSRELQPDTLISKVAGNSAYLEGWARYAERMSEEFGIYQQPSALIMRRVWPARGMVVDPGLHALHWTRQQAIDYLVESGRFTPATADDMVDRIAVEPGQLTAYDSGGLEFFALREEAKSRLGARFDIREFNRTLLEEGIVPLGELRAHVETWIAAKLASADASNAGPAAAL